MPALYVRPRVVHAVFLDEGGEVVPYGRRWRGELPPEGSYGAVSDTGRFGPLHEVARAIIRSLEEAFRVSVRRGDAVAGSYTDPGQIVDAVELDPGHPYAPVVTIAFTDFPGLRVRVGDAETAFPACGCDACDDDVDDLLDDLERTLFDAAGGWPER